MKTFITLFIIYFISFCNIYSQSGTTTSGHFKMDLTKIKEMSDSNKVQIATTNISTRIKLSEIRKYANLSKAVSIKLSEIRKYAGRQNTESNKIKEPPQISFILPSSNPYFTTSNQLKISANIKNVKSEKDIKLQSGDRTISNFTKKQNTKDGIKLTWDVNLTEGQNGFQIAAINEVSEATNNLNVEYRKPETFISKYTISSFISGYYRPNTTENLDGLYTLLEGTLKNANYLEKFPKESERYNEYKLYAQQVENYFRTIYVNAVDSIFPAFRSEANPKDVLEIKINGYTDPRSMRGKYYENQIVEFESTDGKQYSLKKGDDLDNLKLSGLRAWFSGQYLDILFLQSSSEGKMDYTDLKKDGKIVYKYIGAGESNEGAMIEQQRQIKIEFVRKVKN